MRLFEFHTQIAVPGHRARIHAMNAHSSQFREWVPDQVRELDAPRMAQT